MIRQSPIGRWLCVAAAISLIAGPVVGGDGMFVVRTAPGCPGCRPGYSGPCPANVKYYGYFPTCWRRWPGTEPMPSVAPEQAPPNVQVPTPGQEAVGKPGETTDTGATPPATPPTDSGGATTPANPNLPGKPATPVTPGGNTPVPLPGATAPGATTPMLNGLPLPSGTQLPGGVTLPPPTFPSGGTLPGSTPLPGGAAPNILPAPNQPGSVEKGSQLLTPLKNPSVASLQPLPQEPARVNQAWPGPAPAVKIEQAAIQPVATPPAQQPTLMPVESRPTVALQSPSLEQVPTLQPVTAPAATNDSAQRIAPVSAPAAEQWPPANVLRASTIKAGFQSPADMPTPRTNNLRNAARLDPLPPLQQAPPQAPASTGRTTPPPIASVVPNSLRPNFVQSNNSGGSASLRFVDEKPAHAASIPADDWSEDHLNTAFATSAQMSSPQIAATPVSLPTDPPQSHVIYPASWAERSQANRPIAQPADALPSGGDPAWETSGQAKVIAPAATTSIPSQPANWAIANSPASLAPIYPAPAAYQPYGNVNAGAQINPNGRMPYGNVTTNPYARASVNAPGAISPVAPSAAQTVYPPSGIPFSPLRDAVVSLHPLADERSDTSMSAIDPLRIGSAMASDRQPAMKPLPIQNGLSKDRFEASDYVAQDRGPKPMPYAAAQRPTPATWASSPTAPTGQRMVDTSVRQASYQQAVPGDEPKLQSIDPLEVARSLSATPAAPPSR